jgi:hypothetical protein
MPSDSLTSPSAVRDCTFLHNREDKTQHHQFSLPHKPARNNPSSVIRPEGAGPANSQIDGNALRLGLGPAGENQFRGLGASSIDAVHANTSGLASPQPAQTPASDAAEPPKPSSPAPPIPSIPTIPPTPSAPSPTAPRL